MGAAWWTGSPASSSRAFADGDKTMRILLLAHSFNSLTQRLWVELIFEGPEMNQIILRDILIQSQVDMNMMEDLQTMAAREAMRELLKDDGMGFSFHVTTMYAGEELHMHYQNHLEAVLVKALEPEATL